MNVEVTTNVCQCPKCDSHSVVIDDTDAARWHDEDDSLRINYTMKCQECGALLVLHTVATSIEEIKI